MQNIEKNHAKGLSLLTGLIVSVAPPMALAKSLLYAIDNENSYLSVVDKDAGVENLAIPISVPNDTIVVSTGLAVNPLTNEMYAAVQLDSSPSGQQRSLIRINAETGEATVIGNIALPIASLAFTDDGTLFGVTGDCARCNAPVLPETLYTINTSTGSGTFFQTLGNGGDGEAIAFDPDDGMMYHMSGTGGTDLIFEKVDLTTRVVTSIPLSGYPADNLEAIGFTYDQARGLFVGSLIQCFCDVTSVHAYVTLTPDGLLTYIGSLPHWWKDYAFHEVLDLDLESLSDVDGNGSPDLAVMVSAPEVVTGSGFSPGIHVYVKDGATGHPISEALVFNYRWRAIDLAVISNGPNSLVAVLAQRDDGVIKVALYRAASGALVRRIAFFSGNWVPSLLTYVPQADGQGNRGLAVLAKNVNDERVAVQLRRPGNGSLINTVTYFRNDWRPIDLETMPDISGNDRSEVIVLGRSAAGQNSAVIRDAATRAIVNNIRYFGTNVVANSMAVLSDVGASAAPELPVLGEPSDGRNLVQIRDAATDELVSKPVFLSAQFNSITVAALGDLNGNSSPDLAVLGQDVLTRLTKAQVRDGSTGGIVQTMRFFAPRFNPRSLAVFDDIDGNSLEEIGVLAERDDGLVRVQIRDASNGSAVKTIAIP